MLAPVGASTLVATAGTVTNADAGTVAALEVYDRSRQQAL